MPLPVVVLISGNGSNFRAMYQAQQRNECDIDIRAVVSNNPDALGLEFAREHNITHHVLDHRIFLKREEYDEQLRQCIEQYQPELIILAGFMRILTPEFVNYYHGKIINIHPSLLPHYKGLNTHQRVLDNQEKYHGVSVHLVNSELDGGPVLAQVKIPVLPNDNAQTLKQRVQEQEHWLYPTVLDWFAKNRVQQNENGLVISGQRPPIGLAARVAETVGW